MPIVQAYKCTRTKKLFEEKDKYLAHLKVLALESFRDKEGHAREAIIKSKFDDMRKNARALEDVSQWLMAHQRYLVHLSVLYNKLSPKKARVSNFMTDITFKDVIYEFWGRNSHEFPLNGELNFKGDPNKIKGYPCIRCDIHYAGSDCNALPDLGPDFTGIMFGSGGGGDGQHEYQAMLFAEDWPFIGASFLFDARNQPLSEARTRILTYAFPGISTEQYSTYQDAGLLPENTADFNNWIFSFVDQKPHSLSPTEALPDDLVSANI